MNASPHNSSQIPTIWVRLLKALLVLVLSFGGLLLIAKLFPLPKGMGFQYVAHPFWAIVGIVLATLGYLITAFVRPAIESKAFWIALIASLGWSLLIFLSP